MRAQTAFRIECAKRAEKRDRHAWAHIVTERHRAQKARTVNAEFFTGRERRGDDRTAGVRVGFVVRVVGFVGLRKLAIGKSGVDRRRGQARPRDRARTLTAMRADEALRRLAGTQLRSRDHRRERVQEVMLRVFRDVRWKRCCAGRAHVPAERGHLRPHRRGRSLRERRREDDRGGRHPTESGPSIQWFI